ncbi:MAG: hypothetical protein WAK93_16440 [Solirubrobacteraceae bacterium]
MAQVVRNVKPGHAVIHPNRDKWSCKITRLIIVGILIASIVLMLILTIGGWSKLQGLRPINFVVILVYAIIAFYILRWARGLLPIAAGLGILLLIVVVIAATGLAGTSWFARHNPGFGPATSLFGGKGLGADLLGTLTVVLIPIEIALIVLCLVGFAQGWNVETEVTAEEAEKRGSKIVARGPEGQAA